MMATFTVDVTQRIEVNLDEAKFDEAFMAEFRDYFFSFDSIEEHAEHIAQLQARGIVSLEGYAPREFIEGYGLAKEMGISARVIDTEIEQVSA
jgi:hypothetical protein|tara:strand:+ start:225 stop:503 length:279 start_codon:yes stop_codon:yes gene_type:complete